MNYVKLAQRLIGENRASAAQARRAAHERGENVTPFTARGFVKRTNVKRTAN